MLMGALTHGMHPALQHLAPGYPGQRPGIWPVIMPLAIVKNRTAAATGVFVSDRFKDMSADAVYNVLLRNCPQVGMGQPMSPRAARTNTDRKKGKPAGKLLDDHSQWDKNRAGWNSPATRTQSTNLEDAHGPGRMPNKEVPARRYDQIMRISFIPN